MLKYYPLELLNKKENTKDPKPLIINKDFVLLSDAESKFIFDSTLYRGNFVITNVKLDM